MANKITTVLEFVGADGASKQIKRLSQDFQKAEGASAKFKVASAGFKDVLKQNVAQAAAVAGTALVAFGVKSVQAFQETALEAGKFADATGLAVDDASRWIEVAGDVGVSAETMEGAFLRLNKAIGDGAPVLEEYGIQAQYGADGQVDVNKTMLEAIRVVGKIKDPTERAAAAQQLFGRSYAQAAEIIFDSADNVAAKLGEVSEAKVIDEEELEKARKFRELMDNLQDAIQDMSLAAGEYLVPVLQDAGETIADLNEIIRTGTGGTNDLTGAIKGGLKVAMGDWRGVAEDAAEAQRDQALATDLATTAIEAASEAARIAANDAHQKQVEATEDAMHGLAAQGDRYVETLMRAGEEQDNANRSLAESRDRAAEASRNIQALDTEWQQLQGTLSDRRSLLDVSDAFDNLEVAAETAFEAAKTGGREAETAARDHERSLIDLKLEVGRYGEEVLNLPDASITVIQSLIDQGKFAEAEAQLAWLSRGRDIPLTPKVGTPGGSSYFARGTQSAPAGLAVVGEEGPELVAFRGGEKVFTAGQTRSMLSGGSPVSGGGGSINITVNAGMGTDGAAVGRQIVKALNEYKRSGGQVNI